PVSSRGGGVLLGEVSVEGTVAVGVVGLVVLPATPDHQRPGASEHANRLWVAHAAGAGSGVDVGGPGVGVAGVVGEVGQCPAEFGGLLLDGVNAGQQGEGDVPAGGSLGADESGRGGAQPVDEHLGRGAPAVALGGQPGGHRLLVEGGGLGSGGKAAQEGPGD